MVKVPRLTVRTKLVRGHWAQKRINGPLGQWQHVVFCDESRFMLFRIDNRIRVRRLVVEAMNENCTHGNVAQSGGSVQAWDGISHMGKTTCAFWIRCHWSRLSPEFWRNCRFSTETFWRLVFSHEWFIIHLQRDEVELEMNSDSRV